MITRQSSLIFHYDILSRLAHKSTTDYLTKTNFGKSLRSLLMQRITGKLLQSTFKLASEQALRFGWRGLKIASRRREFRSVYLQATLCQNCYLVKTPMGVWPKSATSKSQHFRWWLLDGSTVVSLKKKRPRSGYVNCFSLRRIYSTATVMILYQLPQKYNS